MQIQEQIDNRQGKQQLLSNIKLVNELASYLKTTLGPYGLDKAIINGENMTITNDGATIIKKLAFQHPIMKLMEHVSSAQDDLIGDGTTTIVLLINEILSELKSSIERYDISLICECLDDILALSIDKLEEVNVKLMESLKKDTDFDENKGLVMLSKTALTSKILNSDKDLFSKLIVNSLNTCRKVHLKKIKGGSISDSFAFQGIAFEKCFTYAGYEQQPKKIENPKILLTNVELEWKSERSNAELRIEDVEEYQKVVDAEWSIIKSKLDFIIKSGAKVVFSSSAIGDYATQYFARSDIFCSGRVFEKDMNQMAKNCNAKIISSLNFENVKDNFLGTCSLFEERQIGDVRYNFIHNASGSTIILRGPGDEIINEVERSLNDALMVVRKSMDNKLNLNIGGGANEIELAIAIKKFAMNQNNEKMFVSLAVSKAFENIVGILATNFGMNSHDVIAKLINEHNAGNMFHGIHDSDDMVGDMNKMAVYEPFILKLNIIKCSFEAIKVILMIDSTILVEKPNN